MIDFTIKTEIERPVADVFAYVTDATKLATWQTNTVSAVPEPDGPLALGTRVREVHSAPGGKQVESVVEVRELEPDRTLALTMVQGALPIDARITFEATRAGTLMRFRAYGQPKGLLRIAQPVLRRILERQFTAYCATLKQVLESS